ncbi:hypothetical protein ACWER9_06340 [Micromonospora sp. NPDC003944]
MHIVPRKLRQLLTSSPPAEPAGPAIQVREQAAAAERLREQARQRVAEHRYEYRPAR